MEHDHTVPDDETPEVLQVSRRGRRAFLGALSIGAAAGAVSCDKGNSPTPVTTTAATTSSTTSSTIASTTSSTTTIGPTFTLTVIVMNATTGRGLQGAVVAATSGPQAGRAQSTDVNGRCELNGMAASTFSVGITLGGYNPQTQTVSLTRDQSLEVRLSQVGSTSTVGSTTSVSGGGGGNCTPGTPPPSPCTSPTHYWYPN
jgi:hypothetical protein